MNSNYDFVNCRYLNYLKSFVYEFCHKFGAKIMFIQNLDENKSFSISFKTNPFDNCGVFHILEHIILMGSRKYNFDVFNSIYSGASHTYLNAITYDQTTMYLVSSYIKNHFDKILDMYLDGIFFPSLDHQVFELEGIGKKQKYNGVVFNEMINMYNLEHYSFMRKNYKTMFKGTCLEYDAAGLPNEIKKLKYRDLLNTFRDYYIPENCYLFFYGNLDINYYLNLIDLYFVKSRINKKNNDIFKQIDMPNNNFENLDYSKHELSISFFLNNNNISSKHIVCIEIINHFLFILYKKDFLKNINASYVKFNFNKCIMYPTITIYLKMFSSYYNIDIMFKDSIKKCFTQYFDKIILTKIKENFLFSKYSCDFGYKTKGIHLITDNMNFWKNKDFDINLFEYKFVLDEIDYNYCLDILDEFYFKSKKSFSNMMFVNKNQNMYSNQNFSNQNFLNQNFLNQNIKNCFFINKDILNNIIKKDFEKRVEYIEDIKIILTNQNIDDEIFYLDFIFDISSIDKKNIEILGILIKNIQIKLVDFRISSGINNKIYLIFCIKGLTKNFEDLLDRTLNQFIDFDFLSQEFFYQLKDEFYEKFLEDSIDLAILRSIAAFKEQYKYIDSIQGIGFFEFLKNNKYNNINFESNIKKIHKQIFNKNNLSLGLGCSTKNYYNIKNSLTEKIKHRFENANFDYIKNTKNIRKLYSQNQKIFLNHKLYTNVVTFDLSKYIIDSCVYVLFEILKNFYLYNNIRIKLGAYSYGYVYTKSKIVSFYSSKDSCKEESILVMKKTNEYISSLNLSKEELDLIKMGTLNNFSKKLSNYEEHRKQIDEFLNNIKSEDSNKIIQNIQNVSLYDLKNKANMFSSEDNIYTITIGIN